MQDCEPTHRRAWQFSLSTILLLTALAAISVAWWCDHRELTRRLEDAERRIQVLETSTFWDDPIEVPGIRIR